MKQIRSLAAAVFGLAAGVGSAQPVVSGDGTAPHPAATMMRVPASPLVTHDPYFSVWSFNDRLTDEWPRHWTGTVRGMAGMVRIDGVAYRWLGPASVGVPALEQVGHEVRATSTHYRFKGAGIELTVEFMSPTLPDDLVLFSRPVSYITWKAVPTDQRSHDVSFYVDVSGEWCTNESSQRVTWSRVRVGGRDVARMGAAEQPVLQRSGDNLRQDWGWLYLTGNGQTQSDVAIHSHDACRSGFAKNGELPASDDLDMPRAANDRWPVLACATPVLKCESNGVTAGVMLAYDDEFAIEYFHRKLRPYWRRTGDSATQLLESAGRDFESIRAKAEAWDRRVRDESLSHGGEGFAELCALAYRQTCAGHKLAADWDGTPLLFSKENFSNGCIATVDVSYPSAPFFLWSNPELMEAMLRPMLDYGSSPRWKFDFAPHDLGTYPKANGQVYGGGERTEENQMPVEECGNMLLMVAAHRRAAPSSDIVERYRPVLDKWADYLVMHGLDPANQLCTDDFAGHLARNANLSMKAVVALGAYADALAGVPGAKARADELRATAERFALEWRKLASGTPATALAFGRAGSWSQKYNLVWDRVLGLQLFPASLAESEVGYYITRMGKYGLPLDNRAAYTKLDWIVWSASLTGKREDFDAIMQPVYRWVQETPTRVPLTDWYDTATGAQVGFQARTVVGGVFLPHAAATLRR